jgi:hypothetical protein
VAAASVNAAQPGVIELFAEPRRLNAEHPMRVSFATPNPRAGDRRSMPLLNHPPVEAEAALNRQCITPIVIGS